MDETGKTKSSLHFHYKHPLIIEFENIKISHRSKESGGRWDREMMEKINVSENISFLNVVEFEIFLFP